MTYPACTQLFNTQELNLNVCSSSVLILSPLRVYSIYRSAAGEVVMLSR